MKLCHICARYVLMLYRAQLVTDVDQPRNDAVEVDRTFTRQVSYTEVMKGNERVVLEHPTSTGVSIGEK